jgi:hypothetical protein
VITIDEGARAWIDHVIAASPAASALGVQVVATDVDCVRIRLPYDDRPTTVRMVGGEILAVGQVSSRVFH